MSGAAPDAARLPWLAGDPWTLVTEVGAAAELHGRSAELISRGEGVDGAAPIARSARVLQARRPALVLGAAEVQDHVNGQAAAARDLEVVRRRSGGGAVLVGQGRVLWVDLVIGRRDPLWNDDVGRASWWVGELWVAALAAVGIAPAEVWRGAMVRSPWSDRACFAGLGPGEVTVDGRKVVGVAQRRTSAGALFQSAALLGGPTPRDPAAAPEVDGLEELVAVQSLEAPERAAMLEALTRSTFLLPPDTASGLVPALRALLDAG